MKRYNLHINGWVYSMTVYGMNKRDAIARFREQHYINRMPKGYAIWEAA